MTIQSITAQDFKIIHAANNDALLLDVRSVSEFNECHVRGAILHPLPELNVISIANQFERAAEDEPIYILCKAGGRAKKAADLLAPHLNRKLIVVEGGTDACIAHGVEVLHRVKEPWSVERQTRMIIGILVVLGFILGQELNVMYYWLSAAMGAALIITAVVGFCPVSAVLGVYALE